MVWDNPYGTIQPDRHKKSTFYEPGVNEQLKLLQPSESVSYTMSWDFYVHPLRKWEWGQKEENIELTVETTKKEFRFPHQILSEEIHWIVPGASTPVTRPCAGV